ncbi:SidA/IucD/PvdA family monooxygenase [Nocardia arthritidis]|uniref:SidA/IucD/PvdA family monooxygenase n=1 Tax=Nocardia arthritidis TaxID=228602 RepID=UPI00142E10B4|nr:SidA/IucD/PvdA family monooxygenase [Nocardia arthritidis]
MSAILEPVWNISAGTLRGEMNSSANGFEVSQLYDLVGVGFGPSNLALAVAAQEIDPVLNCLFVERSPEFSWHPGMMFEGSRMQISFLKDLVLMRNLASPYSFLNYLKQRGRLEDFVNLGDIYPSRMEYSDYLCWVAGHFDDDVVYGTEVTKVSLVDSRLFEIVMHDNSTNRSRVVRARNVVVAPGGTPKLPRGVDLDHVIHSSRFLPNFPQRWPDPATPRRLVVAGDGQSAAEIAAYVLQHHPDTELHLVIASYALRPADSSPFVNEQFYSTNSSSFYRESKSRRAGQLADLRNTNYGVVETTVLNELYRTAYLDKVRGCNRLVIHRYSRITGIRSDGGAVVTIEDRFDGTMRTIDCDAVVMATGYERQLDSRIFEEVIPHVAYDEAGDFIVSENYRVELSPGLTAGLYIQGLGERSFGIGDTLLSLLPFRSEQIVTDIRDRIVTAVYPPRRHLEENSDKLYAVIERFKLATVVSARGIDDPVVTRVPLILERGRGSHGVLFGHFDRANPHARLLDGRVITVLFHGPDSYISSHVYATDQLPTWNSVTVEVRGRARLLRDRDRIVAGLCRIAKISERFAVQSTLRSDDKRIVPLLEHIVAFEIEITDLVGRFKLSQDRDEEDRRLAAEELATAAGGQRDLIGYLVDMSLEQKSHDSALVNGSVGQHLPGGTHSGQHT